tara:strand:+ start:91485 stop:92243 length:759 start_codon:yes stop_codon:yes gene_type:complete
MKSLITIIDEVLSQPKQHFKGEPRFRPSSLGSPCLRKIYYSYNNVEPDYPFPLNAQKIMNLGDSVHELLADYFRKAGILVDYKNKDGSRPKDRWNPGKFDDEFPLKDKDLQISAKIDAVMIIDGLLELGEWKSINDKGFGFLRQPKDEHITQIAIYYFLFNKALENGTYAHIPELKGHTKVERCRILYYNKNSSKVLEFIMDEKFLIPYFVRVVQKMELVKSASAGGEIPPKADDWCQSCSYRDKCLQSFKA